MPLILDPVKVERNTQRIYGCSSARAIELNGGRPLREAGTLAMHFYSQQQKAGKRGIEWKITFPEWMAVWTESGLIGLRGRGKGRYCMARCGDIGPYAIGNVFICEYAQNSSDGYIKTPASVRTAKRLGNFHSA